MVPAPQTSAEWCRLLMAPGGTVRRYGKDNESLGTTTVDDALAAGHTFSITVRLDVVGIDVDNPDPDVTDELVRALEAGGHEYLVFAAAAALTFVLTGLPRAADQNPTVIVIALAAAVAVCALVLPGVSGSYLLLTVGMYAPTLAAVNDRDFGYLGTFILGAILGLGLFVSGLQWLLARRRRITLVVMTGLMAGSLRALWPWQDDDGGLQAAGSDWPLMLGLAVAGAAVILALIALERMLVARRLLSADVVSDPATDAIPTVRDPE